MRPSRSNCTCSRRRLGPALKLQTHILSVANLLPLTEVWTRGRPRGALGRGCVSTGRRDVISSHLTRCQAAWTETLALSATALPAGTLRRAGSHSRFSDDWLREGNAHRALKESWVGQTSFSEIPDYVEETSAPMCGSLFSLGPLRPPAPPLLRPVRVLPKRHYKLDPLPAVPLPPDNDPRRAREFPEVLPEVHLIVGLFSACAGANIRTSTSRDHPLLLAGGSYRSRRPRDGCARGCLLPPRLGLSSSGADPSSRVRQLPLRDCRLSHVTDHPCGRRARCKRASVGEYLDRQMIWPASRWMGYRAQQTL